MPEKRDTQYIFLFFPGGKQFDNDHVHKFFLFFERTTGVEKWLLVARDDEEDTGILIHGQFCYAHVVIRASKKGLALSRI
jgi:hypothetical protein